MGASYVILAGAEPARAEAETVLAAAGWLRRTSSGALSVWSRSAALEVDEPWPGLVVVGRPWAHPRPCKAKAGDKFGWLVGERHGGYVAAQAAAGRAPEVLRSPSGALDAVGWTDGGLALVSDDLAGLPRRLWPRSLSINWDRVAGFFHDPAAVWGRTALDPLIGLAPGEALVLSARALRLRTVWRPSTWAVPEPGEPDPTELVSVVTATVADAARDHERLLLEVSGGLDSAIIATSLAQAGLAGRAVLALNQYSADAEGDERRMAEFVCAKAGVPLRAVEKPIGALLAEDFTRLADGIRPTPHATDFVRERLMIELGAETNATAILTGQGGDVVFYQMASPWIVADLVQAKGWRGRWGAEAQAVARWQRRSMWSLPAKPRLRVEDLADTAFSPWLGERAKATPLTPAHPWLEELDGLPPGKQLQIAALAGAQMKHGRTLRGAAMALHHPLLAQPVVELCLQIPSWRLTDGRDRGFARRAFAGQLPAQIAARRSKGALSTLYAKRMASSLEALRPWLLDGLLCQEAILDRRRLEAALTPDALLWEGMGSRLAGAAMIEGWLRYWQAEAKAADRTSGRG